MLAAFIIVGLLALIFILMWVFEWKKRKNSENEYKKLQEKYACIEEAESKAASILNEAMQKADNTLESAKSQSQEILDQTARAQDEAKKLIEEKQAQSQRTISLAIQESTRLSELAQKRMLDSKLLAEEADKRTKMAEQQLKSVSEKEQHLKDEMQEYEQSVYAIRRVIDGYGEEWLKPSCSLLDDLSEEFGYTDAGLKLKEVRKSIKQLIKNGKASSCDYVETNRSITACRFVLDAFNGKVDSILTLIKSENYGVLERKIKDAYNIVNVNGKAFRNARIEPVYLDARLEELKWASTVQALKEKAAEEQRELREKMREEEKARKEYERAQKEALKEENTLQKAMERTQAMLASANEEQRKKYEAEIKELENQLEEARIKNQRALSMAQQTKHGTVYVISNIGSFGENVYKVGMTRRLNPMDRVKELGDASVPFPFDIHAFIESDDAPTLETTLHHDLAEMQVNKVNPRKEFFRVNIATIRTLVEKHGYSANWTMDAKAAEYRESRSMSRKYTTSSKNPDGSAVFLS